MLRWRVIANSQGYLSVCFVHNLVPKGWSPLITVNGGFNLNRRDQVYKWARKHYNL